MSNQEYENEAERTRVHKSLLSQFLAKYDPDGTGRRDGSLYQELVDNNVDALYTRISLKPPTKIKERWPWGKERSPDEWFEFYDEHSDAIDAKAEVYRERFAAQGSQSAGPSSRKQVSAPATPSRRNQFTKTDDCNLVEWLATEYPTRSGRQSINTYHRLVENTGKWPWAARHTAESWKERYKKRTKEFAQRIVEYQKQHGILNASTPRAKKSKAKAKAPAASQASGSKAKSAGASAQASSSSQVKAKKGSTKKAPAKRDASDIEPESDAPQRSQQAKGKQRAVPQEEEEEEEEADPPVVAVEPPRSPIDEEAERDAEPEPQAEPRVVVLIPQRQRVLAARRPRRDVVVEVEDDDDDGPAAASASDQSAESHRESPQEPSHGTSHNSTSQESESQEARQAAELLFEAEDEEMMEGSDVEADRLMFEDDDDESSNPFASPTPSRSPSPPQKPRHSPIPAVRTQEPTPPTSDDVRSPARPPRPPAHSPQQPIASTSSSQAPAKPSPPRPPPSRSVLRKRTHDEIFEDFAAEAESSTPRPAKRRALPVLEEGAFFTTGLGEAGRPGGLFKGGRRRSGVNELPAPAAVASQGAWPPKRDKGKGRDERGVQSASREQRVVQAKREEVKAWVERASQKPQEQEFSQSNPFAEPSQVPAAAQEPPIASSSRVVERAPSVPQTVAEGEEEGQEEEVEEEEELEEQEEEEDEPAPAVSPRKSPTKRAMAPPGVQPARSSNAGEKSLAWAPQSVFRPQIFKGKARADAPLFSEPGPSTLRRRTLADPAPTSFSTPSYTRGIRPRHSLPLSAHSSFSPRPAQRAAPPVAIDGVAVAPEDQPTALAAGVHVLLQQMAAEEGFPLDVVRQGWRATRRLALTREWLRRMSAAVSETAPHLTRELVSEAEASGYYDDEDPAEGWEDATRVDRSAVYEPPEDSRAAGFLRAERERLAQRQARSRRSSGQGSRDGVVEDDEDSREVDESLLLGQ